MPVELTLYSALGYESEEGHITNTASRGEAILILTIWIGVGAGHVWGALTDLPGV